MYQIMLFSILRKIKVNQPNQHFCSKNKTTLFQGDYPVWQSLQQTAQPSASAYCIFASLTAGSQFEKSPRSLFSIGIN
jgi:hypothetical protein